MKFKIAQKTEQFDALRLVSEGGIWELGLWSVMFGRRIRLGKVGEGCVNLDYCAGDNLLFQLEVLNAVRCILLDVPEDVDVWAIENLFPGYEIKPINLDSHCWPTLQALAEKARKKHGIEQPFLPLYDREA